VELLSEASRPHCSGFEIVGQVDVGDQAGLFRLPLHHFPRFLTRGGTVDRREMREPAEMMVRSSGALLPTGRLRRR